MKQKLYAALAILCAGVFTLSLQGALVAQTPAKLKVAYTATSDFASGFIAQEAGHFKKRGLEVEFQLIPLNSTMPAALQSGSIDLAGTTLPVFLQAVDSGLDLVAIAGSGTTLPSDQNFAIVVKPDITIAKPEDYAGKRIGVPGLGAFLHVLFQNWLLEKGVDIKKVTFVEVSFPQMADVLRAGNVDGVITGEPIMSRIVQAKIGKIATYFNEVLKGEMPIIVYSSTRKWYEANKATANAFRDAVADGVKDVRKDDAFLRTSIGKYIKLPPEVLQTMPINGQWRAEIPQENMARWIQIMEKQKMLRTKLDLKKLVAQ
jgi:NitT/TauT family transport system substrate-binding protein